MAVALFSFIRSFVRSFVFFIVVVVVDGVGVLRVESRHRRVQVVAARVRLLAKHAVLGVYSLFRWLVGREGRGGEGRGQGGVPRVNLLMSKETMMSSLLADVPAGSARLGGMTRPGF